MFYNYKGNSLQVGIGFLTKNAHSRLSEADLFAETLCQLDDSFQQKLMVPAVVVVIFA
jgi:hypothetical protein